MKMSSWEKAIFGVPVKELHTLIPGVVFTAILAWGSIWLSEFIGSDLLQFKKSPISAVMLAILLGLIISNTVSLPPLFKPGFTFSLKKLLRLGIILLGVRLSIMEIFKLGALGVPIVIGCIAGALTFTILLARWLKLPEKVGTLIAVGTSICGVSAIVATGPAIDAKEEEVAYAVSVITIFGILATLVYPYLANVLFNGDALHIGLFLGTAVHDTSQVTGAALVYSEVYHQSSALNTAIVTKLVRNIFMALVIPFMALYYAKHAACNNGKEQREGTFHQEKGSSGSFRISKYFPLFIIGFLLFGLLRSIGDITVEQSGKAFGLFSDSTWVTIYTSLKTWAVYVLVVALAGVGLNTRFKSLKSLGIKPFFIGFIAAIMVGGISYVLIMTFSRVMMAFTL